MIFFIWNHGKEELENFIKKLNNFSEQINFAFETDKECVNILNAIINLPNKHLMTNM